MNNNFHISPIAKLHSPLTQKFGTPRQPNLVCVPASIEMYEPYSDPLAVAGLNAFSHIWLIWQFSDLSKDAAFRPQVRPPRLGGNTKLGVFATRSMFRPNRLGLSVVRLEEVVIENGKASLKVSGADLIDGTPIYDIKPYIAYSDSIVDAVSGFALSAPNLQSVVWSETAARQFAALVKQSAAELQDKAVITQLIALDPRPAYKASSANDNKLYTMCYGCMEVSFMCDGAHFEVVKVAVAKPKDNK